MRSNRTQSPCTPLEMFPQPREGPPWRLLMEKQNPSLITAKWRGDRANTENTFRENRNGENSGNGARGHADSHGVPERVSDLTEGVGSDSRMMHS